MVAHSQRSGKTPTALHPQGEILSRPANRAVSRDYSTRNVVKPLQVYRDAEHLAQLTQRSKKWRGQPQSQQPAPIMILKARGPRGNPAAGQPPIVYAPRRPCMNATELLKRAPTAEFNHRGERRREKDQEDPLPLEVSSTPMRVSQMQRENAADTANEQAVQTNATPGLSKTTPPIPDVNRDTGTGAKPPKR